MYVHNIQNFAEVAVLENYINLFHGQKIPRSKDGEACWVIWQHWDAFHHSDHPQSWMK